MLRVNRVPRPAGERDPCVTKLHEVTRNDHARASVVAPNELHLVEGFVGRDEYRGKLRVDRATDQHAVSPLRLRDDQPVDTPLSNPFEDDAGIVLTGQL